jgi:DNA invertase Pin-like site-specific DNA recombinase
MTSVMHQLPRSIDEIAGLRLARWVRESTTGQYDNFGPDAQRELQDRMSERHGLVDTGLAWQSAKSGRTVYQSVEFGAMIDAANARKFDILLVGYVSRFQRNLKQTLIAVDDLHAAGVAVVFCDERIVSSDPERWDELVREAHEAESYSRKLGRRIGEGLAAKRRRLGEPGGQPSYGYTRSGKPPVLEVVPADIERVPAVFAAAAEGMTDAEVAERTGLPFYTVRHILTNPIYIGRLRDGTPARVAAVIDQNTWDRVQLARCRFSRRHPGRPATRRPYALSMLHCAACGRHLIGQAARYRHTFPCPDWLGAARPAPRAFRNSTDHRHKGISYPADSYEGFVRQALAHVSANAELAAAVVERLADDAIAPDPVTLARIERDRESAMSRYRRDRDTAALEATMRTLDQDESRARAAHSDGPTPEEAIESLRELPELWDDAEPSGRKLLAESLFDRIDVLGSRKVKLHPSASAKAQGWDRAWNGARLVVMVGARGFEPPTSLGSVPAVPRRPDAERGPVAGVRQPIHRHVFHDGGSWAFAELIQERLQVHPGPLGDAVDAAVLLVGDPAGEAEVFGAHDDEVAVADALDAAFDAGLEAGEVFGGHRRAAGAMAASARCPPPPAPP